MKPIIFFIIDSDDDSDPDYDDGQRDSEEDDSEEDDSDVSKNSGDTLGGDDLGNELDELCQDERERAAGQTDKTQRSDDLHKVPTPSPSPQSNESELTRVSMKETSFHSQHVVIGNVN